jgi:hypothetical protein
LKQEGYLTGPEYEPKWDEESGLSEKYFLSPFLPPHEDLRVIVSCGEHAG